MPTQRESESRAQKKPRAEITVLATADEGDALLPTADGSGGAARALGYWRAREAPCASPSACGTLVLSAGDEPTAMPNDLLARAMQAMGYAASTAGRAELATSGIPLADARHDSALRIERLGVKFDLIGMRAGDHDDDPLQAVRARVLSLRDRGADVGILLSDLCSADLAKLLEHAARDWAYLVLAIGRRCGGDAQDHRIYGTTLVSAGDGFAQYARIQLTFDRNTGALLRADASSVQVRGGSGAPVADPGLSASLAKWAAERP